MSYKRPPYDDEQRTEEWRGEETVSDGEDYSEDYQPEEIDDGNALWEPDDECV